MADGAQRFRALDGGIAFGFGGGNVGIALDARDIRAGPCW